MKVLPAILCLIAASVLPAQTPPAFDAASIHPSGPDLSHGGMKFSGGRFTVENGSASVIIQVAYGLRDFQVVGGPAWVADESLERFDIQAKADAVTSDKELKLMAQTLLADRFHLRTHRETRLVPVDALVIGKSGSKLHTPKPGEPFSMRSYPGNIEGINASLSAFIEVQFSKTDRPIIDKTGLTGNFNFTLRWTPEGQAYLNPDVGDIFHAIQEQLGLKLESQKAPFEVLVIDSIERPTAN